MASRALGFSTLFIASFVGTQLHAQTASTGIAADRMRVGIGIASLGQTEGAETTARGEVSMLLGLGYLRDPITLRTIGGGAIVSHPVRQQLVGTLGWEIGLARRFALRVSLPVALWNDGDRLRGTGVEASGNDPGPTLHAAAGDLALGLKVAVVGAPGEPGVHAALAIGVTAPMGGDNQFAATGGPTIAPRVLIDYRLPYLTIVLDVQARFARERTLFGAHFNDELVLSGGAIARILSFNAARWHLSGYVEGSGVIAADSAARPGELRAALRVQRADEVSVDLGGGAGLVDAVGSPRFRLFAVVRMSLHALDLARRSH